MNVLEREPQVRSDEHAERWVSAGLITPEQADAIRAFEQEASPHDERRVPIVAELAVYIGSVIALMGGQMVIVRAWDRVAYPGRLAIGVVLAAVGLISGRVMARIDEPGTDRLASFLRMIGTGGVAIAVATTLLELDVDPRAWIAVVTGAAVALVSAWLWGSREERPLQFITLVGGLIAVGAGVADLTDAAPWVAGIVVAALSIATGMVARAGWLAPRWLVMTAAAIGAMVGTLMISELHEQFGLSLACVVAIGVITLALVEREMALLAVGVIGFLVSLQALLASTFNTAVASPIVVAVGLAIVAAALVKTLRRRPAGRG